MIVTLTGLPVEFILTPGSESDVKAFRSFDFNDLESSTILGDKAYNDYIQEDIMLESSNIKLLPHRKKNSKRQHSLCEKLKLRLYRNRIETTFSSVTSLMPRCIRAKSKQGFFLKIYFFIIALSLKNLLPIA